MANKRLTATVRLNTTQAEQKLKKLAKAIDSLNRAVGKRTNAYNDVNRALSTSENITRKVKTETDRWGNSQKKVNANLKSSRTILNDIGTKLRRLASTYLGVMGTGAMLRVSDSLTSAENKLNYTNAKSLGESGYNSDGSYSSETINATADTMNKMYVSAQKVRMGYTDMVSNVSKSMALASDAFGGNVDNAIRFQEVMAEAYAVGGASAEEMSSSMYQLIQALGSGQLAGDELRSVREGAPLAYKAIEEFAQGVWNTDESLKELASDGKVSADMVVAAMLNAEGAAKELDQAFAQTEQTFGQTWTQIKNAATQAFRPISDELRKALQNALENGLLEKVQTVFATISKIVLITFEIIKRVVTGAVNWIADNWDWLKKVVYTALLLISVLSVKSAVMMVIKFIKANWVLMSMVAIIALLIYVFYSWATGAMSTGELIVSVCLIIAAAITLIGIVTKSVTLGIIGVVLGAILLLAENAQSFSDFIAMIVIALAMIVVGAMLAICAYYLITGTLLVSTTMLVVMAIASIILVLLAFFFAFCEEVCGAVMVAVAFIYNIVAAVVNAICNAVAFLISPILDIVEIIVNIFKGGFDSIGDFFFSLLGNMISALLSFAKTITSVFDAIFGTDMTDYLSEKQDEVRSWGKNDDAYTISRDWNVMDRMEYSEAWNDGATFGANFESKLDSFGDSFSSDFGMDIEPLENKLSGFSIDGLGDALGLNFDGKFNFPTDSDVGGSYNMPSNEDLMNGLDGIKDDTGKISDNVELSEEDLSFLRKVAEMEWRKEYTTNQIRINMTNHNSVSGEGDLDGLVISLRDKLVEELDYLPNGVYA